MKTEELMKRWTEVFVKKNHDYGSSWTKVGKILDILFDGKEVKLSSISDLNKLSLLIRILDKISRYVNLSFSNKKAEVTDESLIDTACDAGTYFFMLGELTAAEKTPKDEL